MEENDIREYFHDVLKRHYLDNAYEKIDSDMLSRHARCCMLVQFPEGVGPASELYINLMAPFGCDSDEEAGIAGVSRLEEMIGDFAELKKRNAFLAGKGYQGRFSRYDDGVEFLYSVPVKDEQELVRALKDFSFNDGF